MGAPYLVKTFFGIESFFTRSGPSALLNTTFFAVSLAVSYLCINPISKAVYVLRCFYGDSIRSGIDLKADLQRFREQVESV